MAENIISYTNRTFDDYRTALRNYTKSYYPDIAASYDDAEIGSWWLDITAGIADELSYHIDRALQETNIESAQKRSSVLAIARTNGLKIPGPKGSLAEEQISVVLPPSGDNSSSSLPYPNWNYAPVIKKGTIFTSGSLAFELMHNVDFAEEFDENGYANRTVLPRRDSNGIITAYTVSKLAVIVAGQSIIYKKELKSSDITPFMEITLPGANVMNVESVIIKDGTDWQQNPDLSEFMTEDEYTSSANTVSQTETYRYFEVNSLADQYRFGDVLNSDGSPAIYKYAVPEMSPDSAGTYSATSNYVSVASVTKGAWKPVRQKFITEFTDNGYLKVIFGPGDTAARTLGLDLTTGTTTDQADVFARYQISKMLSNDFLGVLPSAGKTMYILYRSGGGQASNVAAGTITKIGYLNADFRCDNSVTSSTVSTKVINSIKNSLSVSNITPSVSGKDMPSTDEIKYMIKYNNGSQERCVTVKDYYARVMQMPAKYGTPYRLGVTEENNKIMLYLLGVDYQGHLSNEMPELEILNIENYLSEYRTIGQNVEIKGGRIINLSFECDLYVNKNYNQSDVVSNVIAKIKDYMDIANHQMGENIYTGDLEMQISKIDGVLNLIDLRVFNEYGTNYSKTRTTQATVTASECADVTDRVLNNCSMIDLDSSEGILFSEGDTMFEVKYPANDIKIRVKTR